MHPIRPLHGINGRMRQHIHSLGRYYAIGFLPQRAKNATRDEFLNELVESGEISIEELRLLLNEVQTNYDRYSFFSEFSDRILDKADDVFWMKYGRTPEEHEWAIEYKKICQNLKSDPHCYDYLLTGIPNNAPISDGPDKVDKWKNRKMGPFARFFALIIGLFFILIATSVWHAAGVEVWWVTLMLAVFGLACVIMAMVGIEF